MSDEVHDPPVPEPGSRTSSPGDTGSSAGTIRTRVWRDGRPLPPHTLDSTIDADPEDLIWIDLCDVPASVVRTVGERLRLDPRAVEDAIGEPTRTKVSRYAHHRFVTVYAVRVTDGTPRLRFAKVAVFVLDRGLVTVRSTDILDVDEVVARWDDDPALLRCGSPALLYGLLDVVVDEQFAAIGSVEDSLEVLEEQLFDGSIPIGVQRETFRVRKQLAHLRRVVLPLRETVTAMLRHHAEVRAGADPTELDSAYTELYDHVVRADEWTQTLRDMTDSVFEATQSLMDAKLNETMRRLTAWAAIIAVPTLITGWFGQNIPFPGFSATPGFVASVTLIAVSAIGLWVVFRRRGWL